MLMRKHLSSIQPSNLILGILGVLLTLSVVGFGAFYYYDRYVHPDVTLVDRQARHLEEMVRKNPQNADLRVAVANYYLDQKLVDSAIKQGKEALKISPDHEGALILLGRAYMAKGDADAAITQFNRVLELNKNNPMANVDQRLELVYYQLGKLYSQQDKYPKAIESLKHALIIDRTDSDAHYLLGTIYQKQSNDKDAVNEFQEALRFVPNFVEAYQGMKTSYAAMGKVQEAAYAQAMVLVMQGKYAAAAKQLEKVLEKSPDLTQAYFGLGIAYDKLGKRGQAINALQRYLKAYPNDIAAQQALGKLMSQGG